MVVKNTRQRVYFLRNSIHSKTPSSKQMWLHKTLHFWWNCLMSHGINEIICTGNLSDIFLHWSKISLCPFRILRERSMKYFFSFMLMMPSFSINWNLFHIQNSNANHFKYTWETLTTVRRLLVKNKASIKIICDSLLVIHHWYL